MTLALGLAPHTGWAIAVVIEGRTVIDKRRIEFRPTSVHGQVFHAAEGKKNAATLVSTGVKEAHAAGTAAIGAFEGISTVGIVGAPRQLPELDRILANHMLLHAAEGELYRAVLEDACTARGWSVVHAHSKALEEEAEGWKGASPSPWQADHRLAAAVALRSVGA